MLDTNQKLLWDANLPFDFRNCRGAIPPRRLLFIISLFYTSKEATTRMVVLYTGNMLASTFSSLISAGVIAGLDKKHGLAGSKVALPYPRRRHCRSGHYSLVYSTKFPTTNTLAYARRAKSCARPHCPRYNSEESGHQHLDRTPRGMHRLLNLDLCTNV